VPETFIDEEGAVKDPLITTLLKELVFDPLMAVVPPKVTVPDPELRVPLFTRLPLIAKAEVGVSDPVTVTVTLPNITGVLPEMLVAPEKVIELLVKIEGLLLSKFPFKSIGKPPALNTPLVRVKSPLIVAAAFKLICPLLFIVRFLS